MSLIGDGYTIEVVVNPLGDLIRTGRTAKRLSQRAFAKVMGVSQGAVSSWESGEIRPDVSRLTLIADTLDLQVGALAEAAAAKGDGAAP